MDNAGFMNVVIAINSQNIQSKHYNFVSSYYWKSEVLNNNQKALLEKYTLPQNIIKFLGKTTI